jgi:tetratricopeptide (TPR) repeat protein
MDTARWQRLRGLFDAALELDASERPAFVARSCAGDSELQRTLESLLEHSLETGSDFDQALIESVDLEGSIRTGLDLRDRTLGRYRIIEKIGEGGTGEVYRATDTRLGRDVAIKILPEVFTRDPERVARFEREAQVLASLSHPNIATIHGVEEVGGTRYLVLELVDGVTLRSKLVEGALPIKTVVRLAAQIAEGLAKAHHAGIVHRDLKPENLMLTGDGFIKILDFGLAKAAFEPDDRGSVERAEPDVKTETGRIMGTVSYMSPEQARGEQVDHRSDQFAFGSVLCEMVTGTRAFGGPTDADTLVAIMRSEPERPEDFDARVPPPLRWLIERCLAKDRTERYDSTGDLARDLRDLPERLREIDDPAFAPRAAGSGSAMARDTPPPAEPGQRPRAAFGAAYREYLDGLEYWIEQPAAALKYFQRSSELDPDFLEPRLYSVHALRALGREHEARAVLDELDDRRGELSAYERLGLDAVRFSDGHRYNEALPVLRDVVARDPLNPHARSDHAQVALWTNHPQETVTTLEALGDRHELGYPQLHTLCEALHLLGQHERESEVARAAVTEFPRQPLLAHSQAQALAALGRAEEVGELVEESSPGSELYRVHLSAVASTELRAHGYPLAATEVAEGSIGRLSPESTQLPETRLFLGVLMWAADRPDDALALYGDLASTFPDNVLFVCAYGATAALLGDRQTALQASQRLDELASPQLFGVDHYCRANIAAGLANREEAVEHLRATLRAGFQYGTSFHRVYFLEPLWGYEPFEEFLRPKG